MRKFLYISPTKPVPCKRFIDLPFFLTHIHNTHSSHTNTFIFYTELWIQLQKAWHVYNTFHWCNLDLLKQKTFSFLKEILWEDSKPSRSIYFTLIYFFCGNNYQKFWYLITTYTTFLEHGVNKLNVPAYIYIKDRKRNSKLNSTLTG